MENRRRVSEFENTWGTYSLRIVGRSPVGATPQPVIIFAHGLQAQKEMYQWIGECLAENGYLTLLFTVPTRNSRNPRQWSDGVKSAIDYLLTTHEVIPHSEGLGPIGVMGHSMGGLGVLIAAHEDPKIQCVVGLAPAIVPKYLAVPDDLIELTTPTQVQIGSYDGIVPPENVQAFYRDLQAQEKSLIEIEGGNHMRFTDKTLVLRVGEYLSRAGFIGPRLTDRRASITFEEQHAQSSKGFLEWFNQHLHQ